MRYKPKSVKSGFVSLSVEKCFSVLLIYVYIVVVVLEIDSSMLLPEWNSSVVGSVGMGSLMPPVVM